MTDVRYYIVTKNGRSRLLSKSDEAAIRFFKAPCAYQHNRVRLIKETRETLCEA